MKVLTIVMATLCFSQQQTKEETNVESTVETKKETKEPECVKCAVGVVDWIKPSLIRDPNPSVVGETFELEWKYREVELLPKSLEIQIIKQDGTYQTIAKDFAGTKYSWTPENFSTYKDYKLIIFDTSVGKDNAVPGKLRSTISPKFGLFNKRGGGSLEGFYGSASTLGDTVLIALGALSIFVIY